MNKPGPRPQRLLTALASAMTFTLSSHVGAQTADPAKPNAGLERAQKAADAVFHWIKLNGEKGAVRQGATPAPAPAVAPAPPPPPPPAPRKPVQAAAPRPTPPAPTPSPTRPPEPAAVAVVDTAPEPAATPATPAAAPAAMAAVEPDPETERGAVVVAAAAPTPTPAAPLAAAERVMPPAPAPAEPEEVQLKLLTKVEPTIPRQLLTQMIRNGYAQVQFTVAPDGSVAKAHVLKASHTRLGNAAVDAIRQWRFAPIPQAREAAVQVAFNNEVE